jgi:CRISPR-associated protein Csy1
MASETPLQAQARALLASGRLREARALLDPLAAGDPWAARQLAEIDLAEGNGAEALRRAQSLDAADPETAILAARAEAALGRFDAARERLTGLRSRLAAPSALLEAYLADVEHRAGRGEAAIDALREAVRIDPRFAAAQTNQAALIRSAGRAAHAREARQRAEDAAPGNAGLWMRLARVHALLGGTGPALACADRAAAAQPPDADTWREIGRLRAELWRWEDADRALDEAAARDPGAVPTETLRAVVKQELGDVQGALAALAAAGARRPGDLQVTLGERLMLPQVYEDVDDLARWRARYSEGIARTLAEVERWIPCANEAFQLKRNNFLLAYQGGDDRELQRGYSAVIARLAGAAHPEWRSPRPRTFDGGRRLRIGFVGAIFRECTAGRYFERWVTGLDPARFERFVYHTSPVDDDFSRRIAGCAEHFATMRAGAEEVAARLAADRLDAIVYPEVGMTPMTYLLAALRLAPLQCAAWGHPVTTGSDAIDAYITCAAMEPPDGQSHYVEPLLALPGPGVDYPMPREMADASRTALGLPGSGRLYACPQSLFKIHPAIDELFAAILEADPDGALLFFQAPARAVTMRFAARLQRALAARGVPARNQIKFLPRMGGAAFRRVLALSDVVLDTLHWSGGNTSLDAFAAAAPVVTLPGRFMRGRQTAAMLRMMEVEALIAGSPEEYVRIALETARDRDRNAALREAIARNRGALFDRPEPVRALAEALLAAAAGN